MVLAEECEVGQFFGPGAQEVGGVFERNRMIGTFGRECGCHADMDAF